jgi:murein DD-endopeptidase MepM/ murein hydrolase activator NlpD
MNELSGKVSWFGGPNDPSSGPTTASGASVKEPGIAVYDKSTLGGYWRVTAPNGRTAVLKQTDLGPAPWTGRKVDVTYSALGQLGYNEHDFPTDSVVKASYLGKNRPATEAQIQTQQTQATRQSAIASVTGGAFNAQGYQQAVQHAAGERAAASLFTGSEGGDSLLRQALEQAGTPPSAKTFEGMAKLGSGGPVAAVGNTPAAAGYVHPLPTGFTQGRTDQGVDFSASPGDPIKAIGNGKVLGVESNWYQGQPFVYYELTDGPQKGNVVYVAEQIAPSVRPGQAVRAGQQIGTYAKSGTGIETGWATKTGQTRAMATSGYTEGQQTNAGKEFAAFLRGLK